MNRVQGFAGEDKKAALQRHSVRLPERGALFVRQRNKFIEERICCRVISAADMGHRCVEQRKHQSGGLADLARIFKRPRRVCQRGLMIAKQPQGQRPETQD